MSQGNQIRRIALVGLGSIGRKHLRLINLLRPDIDVFLVRSGYGHRWPEEAYAARSLSSIDEVIRQNIDAAIISSPASFHVEQAIELLCARIPLLIEKPLSNKLDGTTKLKILSEEVGVPVLVGYVLRHSMSLVLFNELLADNVVGQILGVNINCASYLPNWRPGQDYKTTVSARPELGGGVLLEMSHEIDYANWFFGPFKSVGATVKNSGILGIQVEDEADLTLISDINLAVSVHLDFLQPYPTRKCTVQGSKGVLSWDGIMNTVTLRGEAGQEKNWNFDCQSDDMFKSQLQHFLACIEKGNQPMVTLKDGISTLEIIEAAKRSHRERKVVTL